MLLHRFLAIYLYIILLSLHTSSFSMDKCFDEYNQQSMGNVTKIPLKKTISMQPFNKSLYPSPASGLFYPEQCYTKKATLWCVAEKVLSKKAPRCMTVIPFKNELQTKVSAFSEKLESYTTKEKVRESCSHDDICGLSFKNACLLTGYFLYNEHLSDE